MGQLVAQELYIYYFTILILIVQVGINIFFSFTMEELMQREAE